MTVPPCPSCGHPEPECYVAPHEVFAEICDRYIDQSPFAEDLVWAEVPQQHTNGVQHSKTRPTLVTLTMAVHFLLCRGCANRARHDLELHPWFLTVTEREPLLAAPVAD